MPLHRIHCVQCNINIKFYYCHIWPPPSKCANFLYSSEDDEDDEFRQNLWKKILKDYDSSASNETDDSSGSDETDDEDSNERPKSD